MRKTILFVICAICALCAQATTVYTKVNNKPAAGWPGTYIIVYEASDTEAYVWDASDDDGNIVKVPLKDGVISSENLADYQVTVTEEKSNRYYLKTKDGYIGTASKQNGIDFSNGGKECTIQSNGGYTMLETNTNTCRFLCYQKSKTSFRFRFYYDKNKKWADTDKHNICFYVLGEVEQEEPKNQLDIQ